MLVNQIDAGKNEDLNSLKLFCPKRYEPINGWPNIRKGPRYGFKIVYKRLLAGFKDFG